MIRQHKRGIGRFRFLPTEGLEGTQLLCVASTLGYRLLIVVQSQPGPAESTAYMVDADSCIWQREQHQTAELVQRRILGKLLLSHLQLSSELHCSSRP